MIYSELALPVPPRSRWLHVWQARADEGALMARGTTRLGLCSLLAEQAALHAGVEPSAVNVERDKNGKPILVGLPVGYACSLSYGASSPVVALGMGMRIGVDCESLDTPRAWRQLAEDCLSTGEIAVLAHCSDEETARRTFYRLWTRKEALAKASGQAVHDWNAREPLSEGACVPAPLCSWVESGVGPSGYWLIDLPLSEYAVGSVAWA